MSEKLGHNFGRTPFGTEQIAARALEELLARVFAPDEPACACGDPGDCACCGS